MSLPERLVELHRSLDAKGIPHAFGGAIALAYWTQDPRGTSDIDLNIFVPAAGSAEALAALPAAIDQQTGTLERVVAEGQVRLWWEAMPIDLFFDYVPIHAAAAANRREVPFGGTTIPVLGPIELVVFKAMFDRTRDWADIEAIIAAGTVDVDAVRVELGGLVSPEDHRFRRLDEAVRLGTAASRL